MPKACGPTISTTPGLEEECDELLTVSLWSKSHEHWYSTSIAHQSKIKPKPQAISSSMQEQVASPSGYHRRTSTHAMHTTTKRASLAVQEARKNNISRVQHHLLTLLTQNNPFVSFMQVPTPCLSSRICREECPSLPARIDRCRNRRTRLRAECQFRAQRGSGKCL